MQFVLFHVIDPFVLPKKGHALVSFHFSLVKFFCRLHIIDYVTFFKNACLNLMLHGQVERSAFSLYLSASSFV